MDISNSLINNRDDSIVSSYQQLGFSPSAFLNTSNSTAKSEMVTSTPAKDGLETTPKTPSIMITPVYKEIEYSAMGSSGTKKRKSSLFGGGGGPSTTTSGSLQKRSRKTFVSTTPRTPTPLRTSKKEQNYTETKLATIDEISKVLMKRANTSTGSTPDHDYAKMTELVGGPGVANVTNAAGASDTSGFSDFTGSNRSSLRRTLFETPCQNPTIRPVGVNLFTEKELNAIEQMSSCFTPRKDKITAAKNSEQKPAEMAMAAANGSNNISNITDGVSRVPCNEKGFSFILNPKMSLFQQPSNAQQHQQHKHNKPQSIQPARPEIRILPLVAKPIKIPIRRLPPRNLKFSDDNKQQHKQQPQQQLQQRLITKKRLTPTQGDAFRAVAFGQSHDQKFLTEQARLIMKEINQAVII